MSSSIQLPKYTKYIILASAVAGIVYIYAPQGLNYVETAKYIKPMVKSGDTGLLAMLLLPPYPI